MSSSAPSPAGSCRTLGAAVPYKPRPFPLQERGRPRPCCVDATPPRLFRGPLIRKPRSNGRSESSSLSPHWPAAQERGQAPCQPIDDLVPLSPQLCIWMPRRTPTTSTFMRRTPGSLHTSLPSSHCPPPHCHPSGLRRPAGAAPSAWNLSPPPRSPTTSCEPLKTCSFPRRRKDPEVLSSWPALLHRGPLG